MKYSSAIRKLIGKAAKDRPILNNLHFIDSEIRACNLEQELVIYTGKQTQEPFLLPFEQYDKFSSLHPEHTIVTDGRIASLQAGKAKMKIPAFPADDFPVHPEFDNQEIEHIALPALADQLKRMLLFSNKEEDRYGLNSVLIENGHIVSTDQVVLRHETLPLQGRTILPEKACQVLIELAKEWKEDISVFHDEGRSVFFCADFRLVTRQNDAQFPKYLPALESFSETHLQADKEGLQKALRSLDLVACPDHYKARLSRGAFQMETQIGEMNYSLFDPEEELPGIGLNIQYLKDYLKVLDKKEVFRLGIFGTKEPCVLHDDKGELFISPVAV